MIVQNTKLQTPSGPLLQKLFDSLNEIVCVIDEQDHFIYLNQATYKILGYQPEELLGKSCFELMVEEDRSASFKATRDAYNGAIIPPFENRYYHKDGRIINMFWEGVWDFGNKHLYSTGRDISEQRRLEKLEMEYREELETTKKQLEKLLDRITDGFIGLDENARIIYWNKAAESISERKQEDVIGRILWDVVEEPARSSYLQLYNVIKQTNRPLSREIQVERVHRWIQLNAYVSGSGISVFFHDITERKRLQEQLLQEKELQHKRITAAVINATEEERAIVGKELHDNVNQVLTTIKLYNELCLTDTGRINELLSKSTQLLQLTIDEIRALSKRLSAPTLGNILLKDSIGELIEAINVTKRLKVSYKHNIRELNVSDDIHIAIYRIIQEHFTNILKHAQASMVSVEMIKKKQELKIVITDNGIGFDPQHHSKGIGLENMNSRTESINGKLELLTAPGMGCTMEITLLLSKKVQTV